MGSINNLSLNPKEKEALLKVKKILEEKFDLEKIVLFGSKA